MHNTGKGLMDHPFWILDKHITSQYLAEEKIAVPERKVFSIFRFQPSHSFVFNAGKMKFTTVIALFAATSVGSCNYTWFPPSPSDRESTL